MEEPIFDMEMNDESEMEATLVLGKKKTKKRHNSEETNVLKPIEEKKEIFDEHLQEEDLDDIEGCSDYEILKKIEKKWNSNNNEYEYRDLLVRGLTTIKMNKEREEKSKKLVIKPPKISFDGPRKTVFVNFEEIVEILNREAKHLSKFMNIEFGTTSNTDGYGHLVFNGRYKIDVFENILRKYIDEYVMCKMCNNIKTTMYKDKESKLHIIQCNNCGASRSAAKMKEGYVHKVSYTVKEEEY
jgi:translation initiation factor 2 subunit 2